MKSGSKSCIFRNFLQSKLDFFFQLLLDFTTGIEPNVDYVSTVVISLEVI